MSDGLNNARALRILELINDFRTLQVHIRTHLQRYDAQPPAMEDRNLVGHQIFRTCRAQAAAILAANYTPTSLGIEPGQTAETETQKVALQRIILDASTRRFKAHKIYLILAAAIRWLALRNQVLGGAQPSSKHAENLRVIDQRLNTEVQQATNQHVFNGLRQADASKGYWLDNDPTMAQIVANSQN